MKGKNLVRELEKQVWIVIRITGSHHILKKGENMVVVSVHGASDLKPGILNSIFKEGRTEMKVSIRIYYDPMDQVWYVEAPDFYEGILTFGNSIEDAKWMAVDALTGLMEAWIDASKEIPEAPVREGEGWYTVSLPSNVSFAIWIRKMRKQKGLSLVDMADKLGVRYQVYQKLEHPETSNPTLKTVEKIKKVFQVDTIEV